LKDSRGLKTEIKVIFKNFNKIKLFCSFHTRGKVARGAGCEQAEKQRGILKT